MKYLLIYCHSNPKCFTRAIFDCIYESLKKRSLSLSVIDLYADKFDPVLPVDEKHRRRDIHKDPYTASYRKMIEEAEHLVFIYPVWWHSFPAILKGFIDRVMASEFIYTFQGRPKGSLFPKGLMSEKKITCFYTLDAPFFVALFDPGWMAIKYGIFRYCGFQNVKRFYKSGLKHLTEEKRKEWLEKCSKIAEHL